MLLNNCWDIVRPCVITCITLYIFIVQDKAFFFFLPKSFRYFLLFLSMKTCIFAEIIKVFVWIPLL